MPRVFVSVGLLVVLVVVLAVAAVRSMGVRRQQAEREWARQQHLQLKAERATSRMRERKLRRIELLDYAAETEPPDEAERLHRLANSLRQDLALPPKQHAPRAPDSDVVTGEAGATIIPQRGEEPGAAREARVPEIPRLPEPPPRLRFTPRDTGPRQIATTQPKPL